MHTIVIKVWRGIVSEVYSDDPNTEIVSRPGEYAPVQNASNWDWDD